MLEIPWCDQVWWKKAGLPGLDEQRDNFWKKKKTTSGQLTRLIHTCIEKDDGKQYNFEPS